MATNFLSLRKNLGRLIAVLVVLGFTLSPARASPTHTFVVNTSLDGSDSNTSDHVCNNGAGSCSLRAAVEQANATSQAYFPDPVTISFNYFGCDLIPVNLNFGALRITSPNITITGEEKNIKISGISNQTDADTFEISAVNTTLRNLTIIDARHYGIFILTYPEGTVAGDVLIEGVKIIGSHEEAIHVQSFDRIAAFDVTIRNTLIGTTSAESTACVTSPDQRNGVGILVEDNVDNLLIDNCTIVCSKAAGIDVFGLYTSPENTIIQNSRIGTNGTTDMGNGTSGIELFYTLGTQIRNNVISGNNSYGVSINQNNGAVLTGNKIGMNAAGNAAVANSWEGVAIDYGSTSNIIGGFDLAARNWIGGNGYSGIVIKDASSSLNVIAANYIGLGPGASIPNGHAGIAVLGGAANIIGTASTTVPQVISTNTREGIYIQNANGTAVLDSNLIGVDESGSLPRGNGREGIKIVDSTNLSITPRRVSYNGDIDVSAGAGIAVIGENAWNNFIRPLQVDRNSGLPIDLGNDGATDNGSHPDPNGPNKWLPYPELTLRNGQIIHGITCANCRVDIYSAYQDPREDLGGGTFLLYTYADAGGIFKATLPGGVGLVTLTATDAEHNTSEMSPTTRKLYLPLVIR